MVDSAQRKISGGKHKLQQPPFFIMQVMVVAEDGGPKSAKNDSLIAGAPCFFVFLGFFGVKMFIFVVLKIMCNECYVHAVGLGCGVALNFNSGSQK